MRERLAIVVDPMLATGHSAAAALTRRGLPSPAQLKAFATIRVVSAMVAGPAVDFGSVGAV